MASFTTIFFTIFGLNILAIFFLGLNLYVVKNNSPKTPGSHEDQPPSLRAYSKIDQSKEEPIERPIESGSEFKYKFDNPQIAYYLLEKLDIFEVVKPGSIPGANYSSPASGFKINNNYCEEHRDFFVNHPEVLFQNKNFITNHWTYHKIRSQVMGVVGNDIHPEVHSRAPNIERIFKYDMRVDANIFMTYNLYYYRRQIGKQFSCLTQESNHLPGHDKIFRKDYFGQALLEYAKRYESRPFCFNFDKYFPKTWVLTKKEQCLDFFEEFNSERYQTMKKERNVVYFRKIGADVHEGKGVFPVTDEEEKYIRQLYGNGELCGKVKHNNLIQYNVYNPLLVQNRKFGFRMFLLVASANPVIAFYHDGYARLSLNEYNPKSKDVKTFVTNIGVNLKAATQDGPFKGMTEEEINERTCWSLSDFQKYLLENNQVKDPDWLNNYLRVEMKKVMIHLIRMGQSDFFKLSSVYELLGLDFVMDENLQLWFIEANVMPLIDGFTKESTRLINQMLADSFEIVFTLLRARMKRIVNYINFLTQEVTSEGSMFIRDLEAKRQEFKILTMNKFDSEFELSPENTFHKIIDENSEGPERYSGLISQECL